MKIDPVAVEQAGELMPPIPISIKRVN